jgi:long-chain acyl-CoA synthetase
VIYKLPMGWIGEQFQSLYQPLVCRHKLNFVEEPDTVMTDLREIAPTFVFLAPRVWEQIAANVRAQIMDASHFKRWMFAWGVKRGLKAVERGHTSRLAQVLVLRALRDRLGFTRLRFASTGGAPMGPDTFKFFMAMGLPMLQLYGQTELGGIYCIQRRGEVDFDTVGRGFNDDYKIKIDKPDAQGVRQRSSASIPTCSRAITRTRDATRRAARGLDAHGRRRLLKPSGQLVVIDRMRDLATTASGERFSPQYVENKLKFSPTSARPWCSATSAPTSRRSCASASRSSLSGPSRTACRSPPIRTSQAVPRSTA